MSNLIYKDLLVLVVTELFNIAVNALMQRNLLMVA